MTGRKPKSSLTDCRGYFEEIPYLKQLVVENGPDWIELRNKVVIQVSTASFRSVRGRRFIAVVYDEIAFMLTGADYKLTDVELDAASVPKPQSYSRQHENHD